jgi:hypothetical protein
MSARLPEHATSSDWAAHRCNQVRGPDYRNFDFSMIKKTPIHEQMNIEFRAEIFNLTNTPPLGAPNVVFGERGIWIDNMAGDLRSSVALKSNF